MKRTRLVVLGGGALVLAAATASAHVSVTTPGIANATQELTFGVGHGCSGADTYAVRVVIPPGVTSVRTTNSDLGKASVELDGGTVTAVVWQKPPSESLPVDNAYYKLTLRAKLPNQPFTIVPFLTYQTCRASDGGTQVSEWVALTAKLPDGGEAETAPMVTVLPARKAGWNKYTVPVAITDLLTFFGDARIVWRGNAAYSSNTATAEQIGGTEGVTALTSLQAGDEIWVNY